MRPVEPKGRPILFLGGGQGFFEKKKMNSGFAKKKKKYSEFEKKKKKKTLTTGKKNILQRDIRTVVPGEGEPCLTVNHGYPWLKSSVS